MANGWSCNGTRFRMRWKIDVLFNEAKPSWIECRSFTECEISYHCTHHTISHLCCTTPRMLTKCNTIDKNLVPWISQISSFFFLVAKYSQRSWPTRNAYFIDKTISVRDKIAQIRTTHAAESYWVCLHGLESRSERRFGTSFKTWLGSWFELRAFTWATNAFPITIRNCALRVIFCSYYAVRARWLTHALMYGFSAHF